MNDQATELRNYVLQHGPARYDERHNITVEITPKSVETFEEYQTKLFLEYLEYTKRQILEAFDVTNADDAWWYADKAEAIFDRVKKELEVKP